MKAIQYNVGDLLIGSGKITRRARILLVITEIKPYWIFFKCLYIQEYITGFEVVPGDSAAFSKANLNILIKTHEFTLQQRKKDIDMNKKNSVSDTDFCKAWKQARKDKTGVKSLATKFSISPQAVSARASEMRKRGVAIPKMEHNIRASVEDLNAIFADEGEE